MFVLGRVKVGSFLLPGAFFASPNVSVVKTDLNHPNFRPKSHPLAGPAASLPFPGVHEPELGFLLLGPSRDSPPAFRERGQDPKGGSGRGSEDRAGLRSRERLLLDVGSEVSEGALQGQEELRPLRKAIPGSVCQKSRFPLVFPVTRTQPAAEISPQTPNPPFFFIPCQHKTVENGSHKSQLRPEPAGFCPIHLEIEATPAFPVLFRHRSKIDP